MKSVFPSVIFLFLAIFILSAFAYAVSPDELREKITKHNDAIADLEREILIYQEELEKVGKESKTLQGAIRTLDLEQKKLAADMRVTENRIESASLSISELSGGIEDKNQKIDQNVEALGDAMRSLEKLERVTLVEAFFEHETLSEVWDGIDTLERFEQKVREEVLKIRTLKAGLEKEKAVAEEKRSELTALRNRLGDQKQIIDLNRKQKNGLLSQTKNKESEYKKLLADRVALRNAFEQELLEFESELQFAIDPASLPKTGSGVLKWPLGSVKVTQYFGNTAFAKAGGYNGNGHNGIDLRSSVGTVIHAALDGVVRGVGNTDTVCPGASYGKWILIEHGNGLSTLYAHLSLVKVGESQKVNVGEVIGYSGETGYATGPHLHFTVYATQGVRIMQRKSSVCRGTYTMPVADLKAYLNPLLYL